ncbi:MAG: hypothetical protein ACU0BS_07615 [Hasllibacter sp.]
MANEWIIDVLSDLRAFATSNGLERLAEQLDDTTMIAAAELASKDPGGSWTCRIPSEEHGEGPDIAAGDDRRSQNA